MKQHGGKSSASMRSVQREALWLETRLLTDNKFAVVAADPYSSKEDAPELDREGDTNDENTR